MKSAHIVSISVRRFIHSRLLLFFMLFLLTAVAYAQDTPSGFLPGLIGIYAGNGTTGAFINDSLPTNTPIGSAGSVAVDSQGDIVIADVSNESSTIYMVYAGGSIPPILAAVTTNASPAITPTKGHIYEINCRSESCYTSNPKGAPLSKTSTNVTALWFDSSDNLYIADALVYYSIFRVDHASGNVSQVAGVLGNPGSGQAADNIAATSAYLSYPDDVRTDTYGNVYIVDSSNTVVLVVYAGSQAPPVLTAEGRNGLTPGNIYTIAGQVQNYCNNGPSSCTGTVAAKGSVLAYPYSISVDAAGNVYILDWSAYMVRVIYAGGTVPPLLAAEGTTSPTPGDMYDIAGNNNVQDDAFNACSTAPCGDGEKAADIQFVEPDYMTVDTSGNLYIGDLGEYAIRKIDYSGYVSTIAGKADPNQTLPATGSASYTAGGGIATGTQLSQPVGIVFDPGGNLYIADEGYYLVWQATPATPQTITFPALTSPVTYGSQITLGATADSGLATSYTVSPSASGSISGTGSSAILDITGVGSISVTAVQSGGLVTLSSGTTAYYAPVPSVSQTITAGKAPLTVTANNVQLTPAQLAAFNFTTGFTATISGLVNNDSASTAYSGIPAFSTTATASASCGISYPITPSLGSLTSTNYDFTNFIGGTLIVTGTTAQTINLSSSLPSSVTYGQTTSVLLSATTSSGGTVTYTLLSGPGTVSGSTLTINGAGIIKVQAIQEGTCTYAASQAVIYTLIVNPAPLTVTAPSLSYTYGTNITTALASISPTITGWVGSDSSALVSGSATYTTSATSTSDPGSFALTVAQGTLAVASTKAGNYTFATFVPGSITITKASQTISYVAPSSITYGAYPTMTATSTAGLAVTATVTSTGTTVPLTFVSSNGGTFEWNASGVGAATITLSQAGNTDYAAATPVVLSFTVAQAPLYVTATSYTKEEGAANPAFTYMIGTPNAVGVVTGGFQNGDTDIPSVVSGIPTLTTTATQASLPGTYTIAVDTSTMTSTNYYLEGIPGTLTVTQPGTYAITTSPSSLTIQRGLSAQSTLTITPSNEYQGTITLTCGTLPVNVTCTVSPSTYTFTGEYYSNGYVYPENPQKGIITINTTSATVVGSLTSGRSDLRLAGLLIPGAFAGLFLLFARKRVAKIATFWSLCALLALGIGTLAITSCGGSSGLTTAAPGTATITITGSGTTPSGSGTVTATVPLTVTIQ